MNLPEYERQINHRNINKQNIKKSTRMVHRIKGFIVEKSCNPLYLCSQLEKTLDNVKIEKNTCVFYKIIYNKYDA